MGGDKALLDLGGRSAVERVLEACSRGGVDDVIVVRAAGAVPLPIEVPVITSTGEMIDSVRAGVDARPGADVLVFPVDYAMVRSAVVHAVVSALRRDTIVLPIHEARPGHPVALGRDVCGGLSAARTLRDVIRRDPDRVVAVPVADPWVLRDLDTPEDLQTARESLR